jgi:hypothetical protein
MEVNLEETIKKPISDTAIIFSAIITFTVGSLLFAGINLFKKDKYKDWSINIKQASLDLLKAKKKSAVLWLDSLQRPEVQRVKGDLAKDTIRKRIQLIESEIFRIETSWDSSGARVPSAFRSNILYENKAEFVPSVDFEKDTSFFYYLITDTGKLVKKILLRGFLVPFKSGLVKTNMDIFRKYPTVGFWSVLSIAQIVFWSIVFLVSISLLKNLYRDMKEKGIETSRSVLWRIGIATGGTILAFICVFFFCIYDQKYRFNDFFMGGFDFGMQIYGLFGYITAGVLLYSFLLTAYYVQQAQLNYAATLKMRMELDVQIAEKVKAVQGQLKELGIKENANFDSEINNLRTTATDKASDLVLLKDQYKTCKRYFNFFFAITAVILSVLVLWVGSLFASVNSLDLFVFLRQRTGYSFLPYDFVYLYGALHSLLLFIFYVPVKLRLLSMSFSIPEEQDGDKIAIKDTLKKILVRFVEILAASSPLLTAILQKSLE